MSPIPKGRSGRTYEDERKLLLEDMDRAGVPEDIATDLARQSDEYFGKLYDAMVDKGASDPQLEGILGGKRPGP